MNNETILIADNNKSFLKAFGDFLINNGYRIITAKDPDRARAILEKGNIDLAILDIRLLNDKDDLDKSGIELAKNSSREIPKIMLTGFPSWELVRESLGADIEGLPPAVDFLSKNEVGKPLLLSIEWALHQPQLKENILSVFNVSFMMALPERIREIGVEDAADRLKEGFISTSEQLKYHQIYEFNRASRFHKLAVLWAIIGMIVILIGIMLSYFNLLSNNTLFLRP